MFSWYTKNQFAPDIDQTYTYKNVRRKVNTLEFVNIIWGIILK